MQQAASIILASGSPRRQALLNELGIKFSIILKNVDENFPDDLIKEQVALYLARKKAAAYFIEISEGATIITADTIVCIADKILNKPEDRESAIAMLKILSGKTHQVITAVCIKNNQIEDCFFASTNVTFKSFSDAEIAYYVDNYSPYDKAGGYGIQEWIGLIGIDAISGSYQNVVGLPVRELYEHLISLKLITAP